MTRAPVVGVLLLMISSAYAAQGPAPDFGTITTACRDLVLDYAFYRDRPDADAVADLFTHDAEFVIQGQTFRGREEIRTRIVRGQGGPVFRHLMSTIRIFPENAQHARGVSYATVYSAPPGTQPLSLQSPAAVGEYHDEFELTQDGWKIRRREFFAVFVPDAN